MTLSIIKRLLLMAQVAHPHNSIYLFTSSTYCIKHIKSIHLLNQGPLKGGLYSLESSTNNVCFVTNKCSIDPWHTYLNKPTNQILNHLRHELALPSSSISNLPCGSCQSLSPFFHYGDLIKFCIAYYICDVWCLLHRCLGMVLNFIMF